MTIPDAARAWPQTSASWQHLSASATSKLFVASAKSGPYSITLRFIGPLYLPLPISLNLSDLALY